MLYRKGPIYRFEVWLVASSDAKMAPIGKHEKDEQTLHCTTRIDGLQILLVDIVERRQKVNKEIKEYKH